MGSRGPAPQPAKLKLLRGNPGKRRIPKSEPEHPTAAPDLPSWLSAEAKAEWRRIVPELIEAKTIAKVDRAALAVYCEAHADHCAAIKRLAKDGPIVEEPILNRHGIEVGIRRKLHPAVKLKRDAALLIKQFLAEFGLSSGSRARMGADRGKANGDDQDPAQALANRAKADRARTIDAG